jgi:hypothetical protein
MSIPEKNICGMKIIGSQLIAMLTFFEKTLMQRPRIVPVQQAVDNSSIIENDRTNPLKKSRRHKPKTRACKTAIVLKTTIFEAVYTIGETPILNSRSMTFHSRAISRIEFIPPIQTVAVDKQK